MSCRSTRVSFQILFVAPALTLALGASVAIGCSVESTSAYEEAPAAPLQDQGSSSGFPQKPVEDAAAAVKAPPYRGNPLCHANAESCMPDDDGYRRSANNVECATAPPAGDAGAPAGFESKACRITRLDTGIVAPQCFPNASQGGGDGVMCEIGEDCAPGFDCVATEKGKSCRHYCCGGTCKGNLSNGSATFCDVQSLVDVNQKAPVCMPLKRCSKLLGTGECASNESCTVVTEGGDTGCLLIGDKQVGESCDEAHCAAKLTCLGQPGARKCFRLCKVAASDCPSAQTCVTSAAFQDAQFGICQ